MYKMPKLILGVAPTKRSFLSMEDAKAHKDAFMARIREIDADAVAEAHLEELLGAAAVACGCDGERVTRADELLDGIERLAHAHRLGEQSVAAVLGCDEHDLMTGALELG